MTNEEIKQKLTEEFFDFYWKCKDDNDFFQVRRYILDWWLEKIDLARAEERVAAVEIIKDYRFSDWSSEQVIYEQLAEIINRITNKDEKETKG